MTDDMSLPGWLGWDEHWAQAYADLTGRPESRKLSDLAGGPPRPGRVTRQDRGGADVMTADGLVHASWGADVVAGSGGEGLPTTGDFVVWQPWSDGRVTLEAALRRRAAIRRASAGKDAAPQVLAANIDAVAVVESLEPEPQVARIERLLALAWDSGATPHLVLTKADLCADPAMVAAQVGAEAAPGVEVHVVASLTGDGLANVRELAGAGRTLALVGGSGAGKSTLLNALVGAEAMPTAVLGVAGKGRHTTVTRELHRTADGGSVIDTPGLRGVGLLDEGGLAEVFAEVQELAEQCRFGDCSHRAEPGCAVLAAVESGELSPRRLESWRKLRREAAWAASRGDARLRQEQLREWKAITKSLRATGVTRP